MYTFTIISILFAFIALITYEENPSKWLTGFVKLGSYVCLTIGVGSFIFVYVENLVLRYGISAALFGYMIYRISK